MRGQPVFGAGPGAAWKPASVDMGRSRLLAALRRWGFDSLEDMHRQSVDNPEIFWRLVVEDLNITFSTPFTSVRDERDGREFPSWFSDGRLNVADLCVHRHAAGELRDKVAVVYEGESQRRSLTYGELDQQTRRFAAGLRSIGVGAGDRVLLFLPVVPEAVVAFLATASIGAIVVPAFTGLGSTGLAARIRGANPHVIVTCDATTRRGKTIALKQIVDDALIETGAEPTVVVVHHSAQDRVKRAEKTLWWEDLTTGPALSQSVAVESNHPISIIFTSGTTGEPKGIVHSHAGFAVKAATDFAYGFDVHESDVVAWIADMGWMLGPLLIMSVLQLGATLVLTEGVPDYPTQNRLWEIVERNGVTVQGIAPTAARALKRAGAVPERPLNSLRAFASTGEAWDSSTWEWLFRTVGQGQRPVINYTGGTETGGGILISYPFLPADAGAFNGPLPGMDVAVLDADWNPVVGAVGELAMLNTWPGMTHAFYGNRDRYLETYWKWPGVWVHGDLATVDAHGSWRLHGRSDDTLKVSGRRVGPAEIEDALLQDSRIAEAAVVGVPDELRGERVAAFVVLASEDVDFDDLRRSALELVGRSFAPELEVVKGLPKTKNGKIMRRAIRAQYIGAPTGDLSALDPTTPLADIPRWHGRTSVD